MDERLRRLERAADIGGPEEKERYQVALCKIGQHTWVLLGSKCKYCSTTICHLREHNYLNHKCLHCHKTEPHMTLLQALRVSFQAGRGTGPARNLVGRHPLQRSATCYRGSTVIGRAQGWPKGYGAPVKLNRKVRKAGLRVSMYGNWHSNDGPPSGRWRDISQQWRKKIDKMRWYPGQ